MGRKYLDCNIFKRRAEKRKANKIPIIKTSLLNSKIKLPAKVDLRTHLPFIYDQGELGSCTANAFCHAYCLLEHVKTGNISFNPSRLFLYYQERVIEGTIGSDSGADVIDGESYVKKNGICSESSWVYDISKYTVHPPMGCYTEAVNHKISNYSTIIVNSSAVNAIKSSLVNKVPVLIAIAVYSSFESDAVATSGRVPIPNVRKEMFLGGHEICIVGYDDSIKSFIVANSWGNSWGDNGFCYIPYAYITSKLTYELTTINL